MTALVAEFVAVVGTVTVLGRIMTKTKAGDLVGCDWAVVAWDVTFEVVSRADANGGRLSVCVAEESEESLLPGSEHVE